MYVCTRLDFHDIGQRRSGNDGDHESESQEAEVTTRRQLEYNDVFFFGGGMGGGEQLNIFIGLLLNRKGSRSLFRAISTSESGGCQSRAVV